jgi:hypothetical protein
VIVHRQIGTGTGLLHMRPATPTLNDAALPIGATWANPLGTMKITVNWANSAGASVTVAPAGT